MSGPTSEERFVVMDARRRRSAEEKQAIVAELLVSGASVSAVARKHNVAASLLFRWRKQFTDKAEPLSSKRSFVPVVMPAPAPSRQDGSADERRGLIEIELSSGRRIRIDQSVDAAALKRVVDALEGR